MPDEVFEEAERLVRQTKGSRSKLYTLALIEYLARHSPDRITQAMDGVVSKVGEGVDRFVAEASRRVLGRVEW